MHSVRRKMVLLWIVCLGVMAIYHGGDASPLPKKTTTKNAALTPHNQAMTIPILMYHAVADCTETACVSQKNFEKHVNVLANQQLTFLTMTEVLTHIQTKKPFPPRAIAITFDDGYLNNYTVAKPTMDARKMVATLFMVVQNTNKPYRLDWEQLREMHLGGWDIQSHTMTHANLRKSANLDYEIGESKKQLEQQLGKKVNVFCYPFGRFNHKIIASLKRHGYEMAVTVREGVASTKQSPFKMKRIRITNRSNIENVLTRSGIPLIKAVPRPKKNATTNEASKKAFAQK